MKINIKLIQIRYIFKLFLVKNNRYEVFMNLIDHDINYYKNNKPIYWLENLENASYTQIYYFKNLETEWFHILFRFYSLKINDKDRQRVYFTNSYDDTKYLDNYFSNESIDILSGIPIVWENEEKVYLDNDKYYRLERNNEYIKRILLCENLD